MGRRFNAHKAADHHSSCQYFPSADERIEKWQQVIESERDYSPPAGEQSGRRVAAGNRD